VAGVGGAGEDRFLIPIERTRSSAGYENTGWSILGDEGAVRLEDARAEIGDGATVEQLPGNAVGE